MAASSALNIIREAWGVRRDLVFLPGPHPASAGRGELAEVARGCRSWLVSPKCDGERRSVVITSDRLVMVDRTLAEEAIPLAWKYPCPSVMPMVVDAEIVGAEGGKRALVVFDVIQYGQRRMVEGRVEARARVRLVAEIVDLLRTALSAPAVPTLLAKPWVFANCLPDALVSSWWFGISRSTPVRHDGLIFMHASSALTNGNQKDVLKWKPRHTVDCWLLRPTPSSAPLVYCCSDGVSVPFPAPYHLEATPLSSSAPILSGAPPSQYDFPRGCLFELDVSVDSGAPPRLRAERLREDKPYANDLKIVQRTLRHAAENVTLSVVAEMMRGCKARKRDREEDAPPVDYDPHST